MFKEGAVAFQVGDGAEYPGGLFEDLMHLAFGEFPCDDSKSAAVPIGPLACSICVSCLQMECKPSSIDMHTNPCMCHPPPRGYILLVFARFIDIKLLTTFCTLHSQTLTIVVYNRG